MTSQCLVLNKNRHDTQPQDTQLGLSQSGIDIGYPFDVIANANIRLYRA